MTRRIDTVVVGASAGGVESLSRLVAMLPADFPASVFVVIHLPDQGTSKLDLILQRNGALPAEPAEDGVIIRPGHIYCAQPGYHMLLHRDRIRLTAGPNENGCRPAIDPLFRSAAYSRRNRVASVLLSGMLDDGTIGSWTVRRCGGATVCQDPNEALFGDMPRHAIEAGAAMFVLPVEQIGAKLIEIAGREVDWQEPDFIPPDPTEMSLQELAELEKQGRPSPFVCPECGGTLFEYANSGFTQYRCRVGHSFLESSLYANQEAVFESVLWSAVRAIEEQNDLLQKMIVRAESHGHDMLADRYRRRMLSGASRLELMRRILRGELVEAAYDSQPPESAEANGKPDGSAKRGP